MAAPPSSRSRDLTGRRAPSVLDPDPCWKQRAGPERRFAVAKARTAWPALRWGRGRPVAGWTPARGPGRDGRRGLGIGWGRRTSVTLPFPWCHTAAYPATWLTRAAGCVAAPPPAALQAPSRARVRPVAPVTVPPPPVGGPSLRGPSPPGPAGSHVQFLLLRASRAARRPPPGEAQPDPAPRHHPGGGPSGPARARAASSRRRRHPSTAAGSVSSTTWPHRRIGRTPSRGRRPLRRPGGLAERVRAAPPPATPPRPRSGRAAAVRSDPLAPTRSANSSCTCRAPVAGRSPARGLARRAPHGAPRVTATVRRRGPASSPARIVPLAAADSHRGTSGRAADHQHHDPTTRAAALRTVVTLGDRHAARAHGGRLPHRRALCRLLTGRRRRRAPLARTTTATSPLGPRAPPRRLALVDRAWPATS